MSLNYDSYNNDRYLEDYNKGIEDIKSTVNRIFTNPDYPDLPKLNNKVRDSVSSAIHVDYKKTLRNDYEATDEIVCDKKYNDIQKKICKILIHEFYYISRATAKKIIDLVLGSPSRKPFYYGGGGKSKNRKSRTRKNKTRRH